MNTLALKTILLAAAFIISGCASVAPAKRPAYTGADNISSAEASQLVGTWRVNDLNPYPDAEPQDTTIEYMADGKVQGIVIPRGESAARIGDTTFEFNGSWSLNGDIIVHQDVEMSANSDNPMVTMMARLMSKRHGFSGQSNIFELSSDRMVVVSDDGGALEYVRQ